MAPSAPPSIPGARDHALSMASATHLHKMGHIDGPMKSKIHAAARGKLRQAAAPRPFGSLAPMPQAPSQGGGESY